MRYKTNLFVLFLIFFVVLPLAAQTLIPVRKANKWGYVDIRGHEVIPFVYDQASLFQDETARVKKHRKWMFIDKEGRNTSSNKFDTIYSRLYEPFEFVQVNGKYGLVDNRGKFVLPANLDSVISGYYQPLTYEDCFVAYQEGMAEAYFKNKKIKHKQYDQIIRLRREKYFIIGLDGKYGLLDSLGQEIVPIQFNRIGDWMISGRYLSVTNDDENLFYDLVTQSLTTNKGLDILRKKNERYSISSLSDCDIYVDENGKQIIDKTFHTARPFSNGMAMITNFDSSRQVIDTLGNVRFNVPEHCFVQSFREKRYMVRVDSTTFTQQTTFLALAYNSELRRYGVVDTTGNWLIEPLYKKINIEFDHKRMIECVNDQDTTYYDLEGNKLDYSSFFWGDSGEYYVEHEGKWGRINNYLEVDVPIVYDSIAGGETNYERVYQNGKWGYLCVPANEMVIPFIYDQLGDFGPVWDVRDNYLGSFAIAKFKGKYGVIDSGNKLWIPFEYDDIIEFVDKFANLRLIDIEEPIYHDRIYEQHIY